MKVGRFARNPTDEFGNRWMRLDCFSIIANSRQFGIGEIGMYCSMTDWMNRNRRATLFRLGHRVVPLDQRVKTASTEPARRWLLVGHPLFRAAFFFFIVS